MTTTVAVVGASGSIGRQTFDVLASAGGERFGVGFIGVGSSIDDLAELARRWRPAVVGVADHDAAQRLRRSNPGLSDIAVGDREIAHAAAACDVVVNGVVGFAGLHTTVETLRAGKRLALANKESLIAAGAVVTPLLSDVGAEIVPVDSEHCALHQCLAGDRGAHGTSAGAASAVRRLWLTASGGPFRGRSAAELANVSREEALAHPTWSMGPKITVDSSTLMNKGLEVIEASVLFGVAVDDIGVVVHPQSIVHSMVEYRDGATLAQLSSPDMRLCIAYALGFPQRWPSPFGALDWSTPQHLDFEPPDRQTFRCLDLAYDAGRVGGTAPARLSAANEVAVEAFLAGRIRWATIPDVIYEVMSVHDEGMPRDLDDILAADAEARATARRVLNAADA